MTETTRETRYTLRDAARCDGPGPSGVAEVSRHHLRQCVADAERLAELERIAQTGTAENFLQCDDDTKRLMFANHLDESERRKRAEGRIAELETDRNRLAKAARRFNDAVIGAGRAGAVDADEVDAACDELDQALARTDTEDK